MTADSPNPHAPPPRVGRRSYLVVVLTALVLCDFVIATVLPLEPSDDVAVAIVFAVIFGQITAIATWTAFGTHASIARVTIGGFVAAMVSLALCACIVRGHANGEQWMFLLIAMGQWFAISISLWCVRLCFAMRLVTINGPTMNSRRDDLQFGIRQLLIWTSLVAVLLTLGRCLQPESMSALIAQREAIIIVCILLGFNSLLAWPVIWSSLASRSLGVWLIIAAVCCAALTFLENATFANMVQHIRNDNLHVFFIMNTTHVTVACLALLAARASGYRLVRITSNTDAE